jgi:hypothetical protein
MLGYSGGYSINLLFHEYVTKRTSKGHALLARIEGGDAAQLKETITKTLENNSSVAPKSTTSQTPAPPPSSETEEQLEARMHNIMNQSAVVLFMKGNPDTPRCGFSRSAVALLREKNVTFTHFDILNDENVRQGEFMQIFLRISFD